MAYDILINIFVAIITFIAGYVWQGFVSIWIADFVYRGIKIDGIWKATESHETARGYKLTYPSTYTIELKQRADKIYGTAKAEFGTEHREIVCYEVTGNIKDRFVNLSLALKEKKRIAHCNLLLEVVGNGGQMNGYMNFYALRSHEINAIQIFCNRLNNGNEN